MVDLFSNTENVISTIKSALQTFFITKNQIEIFERDNDDLSVFHIHSKNGKKWKIKIEEEEK